MPHQQATLRVFRYKQGQAAPSYQTFAVTADEHTTVLVALQDIRREQDASLALRHSCHHASCGTCGMKVNGREVLSCVTHVLDEGPELVVEPLDSLPLITDLVVDMGAFYDRYLPAQMPYIRHSEFLPDAALPEGVGHYTRYENCLECGLCVSACPITGSSSAYVGPAALAAAWRVVAEPRGQDPNVALDWVDDPNGCWRCHVAYECTAACPSDVEPAESIMALRRRLTRRKIGRWFGL